MTTTNAHNDIRRFVIAGIAAVVVAGSGVFGAVSAQAAEGDPSNTTCNVTFNRDGSQRDFSPEHRGGIRNGETRWHQDQDGTWVKEGCPTE